MGEMKIERQHSVDRLERAPSGKEIPEGELEKVAGGVYSFLGSFGGVPSGFGKSSFERAASPNPKMSEAQRTAKLGADVFGAKRKK